MPVMIAGMGGEGTRDARPRGRLGQLGRAAVAVTTAVAVVLVASRFDRPTPAWSDAGSSSAAGRVEGRLYDVRDLLQDADAWSRLVRPLHPRPPQQGLFGGSGGAGIFGGSGGFTKDEPPHRADEIARLVTSSVGPDRWDDPASAWRAEGWGGWVYVRASAAAHRDAERLLALLRHGGSEWSGQEGAAR